MMIKMQRQLARFFALGLCLLLGDMVAHAQMVSTTTGNTLLEACESRAEFQRGFCVAYITGVTDYDGMDGGTFPERRRSCRPEAVTNG